MSAIPPRTNVLPNAALAAAWIVLAWAAPAGADVPRNASLPAVSPDGRRIAFVAGRGDSVWQVYVVNADGSGTLRLTTSREDKNTPSWSADGQWVRYQSNRGDTCTLSAVRLEGGAAQVIVSLNAKSLALSHDGRRVAYAVGTWTRSRLWVGAFQSNRTGRMEIWIMSADGTHPRQVTR